MLVIDDREKYYTGLEPRQWHKSPATTTDGSSFAWSDPPVYTEMHGIEGNKSPILAI